LELWAIAYDYFLFKPSESDADSGYIHILDLKKDKIYMVEDFVKDHSCKTN
jgi:hypothetical protein